jgi:iron complex outermembrane recepter protein
VDFRINQGATTVQGIPIPVLVANFGTEHFRAEQLFAVESGYRTRATESVALDVAVFANFYDDLRSFTRGAPFVETDPQPTHAVIPIFIVNENRVRSYGVELAADAELASWWMLRASYTHLSINAHQTRANTDGTGDADDQDEGIAPRNQFWLRSSMNLPGNLSLDVTGRYVGRLHAARTRRYTEADVRIAWLATSGMEVALVGQNLLHSEHTEYTRTGGAIERDVYLQLTWRFR